MLTTKKTRTAKFTNKIYFISTIKKFRGQNCLCEVNERMCLGVPVHNLIPVEH